MPINLCSNIILADDDDDDCLLFRDVVAEMYRGVTITRAINGKELLEILQVDRSKDADIIFLDVNMPIKSGFEALTEIKSTNRLRLIPIIMFSTSAQTGAVEKAFELGAHYFVQKPASAGKLKNILEKLLTTDWSSTPQATRREFLISGSWNKNI